MHVCVVVVVVGGISIQHRRGARALAGSRRSATYRVAKEQMTARIIIDVAARVRETNARLFGTPRRSPSVSAARTWNRNREHTRQSDVGVSRTS